MTKLKLILRRFKRLLIGWQYKLSPITNNEQITVILGYSVALITVLLFTLGLYSCSSTKYVPVETNTQVIVKDSLIYVNDTIEVEIPKEVIIEKVPLDTVSVLNTSLAQSMAKVENGLLYHDLKQQGTIKTVIDTCYVTKIEEKITYQEVPVEVTKEVKHIPNWVSYSLMLNFGLIVVIWLFLKKLIGNSGKN